MECFVCNKHSKLDPNLELIFSGFDDFVVSHAPDRTPDESNFIGSLIIEPRAHIKSWAELDHDSSAELGVLLKEVNELLYKHPKVEHVYTWVFGDVVEHFHIWVVPRYEGTPKEYWGVKFAGSPDAPLGGNSAMKGFIEELKALA